MLPFNCVGAGLRREADDDSRAERCRGIESAGLHLDVGDRFGAEAHVGRQALAERAHVGAVHLEDVAVDLAAAQQVHLPALRVVDRAARNAGRDLEEVGPVAPRAERKAALEVAVDVDPLRRLGDLQDRRFGGDLDRLLEFADRHRDVGAEVQPGADDDAGPNVARETRPVRRSACRCREAR